MAHALNKLWLGRYDAAAGRQGGLPDRPRAAARETFVRLGLPGESPGNNNPYRYTDLGKIFGGDFVLSEAATLCGDFTPLLPESHRICLVNGFHHGHESLTRLANGVVFGSLAAAVSAAPDVVERYYDTVSESGADAAAALAVMFAHDGALVYVPAGVRESRPFVVTSVLCGKGERTASFARHLFIVEKGAEVSLVFDWQADGPENLDSHLSETIIGENAGFEAVEIFRTGGSPVVTSACLRQERSSRCRWLSAALGGSPVRSRRIVSLEGAGAENHTDGIMLAAAGETVDFYTDIRHNASDCLSHERFKSIAGQDGTCAFSGRIRVAQAAQRTRAYQRNNSLVLSNEAHVYTEPRLEIYADDVKCSHGATIGQLDPEALYYMRQRGISLEEARRFQMYGFAREVLDKSRAGSPIDTLDELIVAKIDTL